MKFQNCILINFVTEPWTDAHTDGRTSRKQYPPVWGIKNSVDPDELASLEASRSGSTLFFIYTMKPYYL